MAGAQGHPCEGNFTRRLPLGQWGHGKVCSAGDKWGLLLGFPPVSLRFLRPVPPPWPCITRTISFLGAERLWLMRRSVPTARLPVRATQPLSPMTWTRGFRETGCIADPLPRHPH